MFSKVPDVFSLYLTYLRPPSRSTAVRVKIHFIDKNDFYHDVELLLLYYNNILCKGIIIYGSFYEQKYKRRFVSKGIKYTNYPPKSSTIKLALKQKTETRNNTFDCTSRTFISSDFSFVEIRGRIPLNFIIHFTHQNKLYY